MTLRLTDCEWDAQMPPLYWVDVKTYEWDMSEVAIATKWIEDNCTEWFYIMNTKFIFGNLSDATMFQLWARKDLK